MKVKFVDPGGNLPASMLRIGYSPRVDLGLITDDIHIVYGVSEWRGVLHYLIIPAEAHLPIWFPADLFIVIDARLPFEWYFRYYGDNDPSELKFQMGYQELALDAAHSTDLIERKNNAISLFLKRKAEIDEQS
ncbi:MAG: hypothetical protein BGO78_14035 [Chloroflexi bacterium 44-23]|nr:MAG: hypothetical protein BGO78_14035 [Chloroflexi bacterium 44-23]